VARPRRLRHKLMLGLALVVGSVALLLAGTLYGLNAYFGTVRTTERKMTELECANTIILSLTGDEQPGAQDLNVEFTAFKARIENARLYIAAYKNLLAENVRGGHDPDGGHQETALLGQLEEALVKFWSVLEVAQNRGETSLLRNDPSVRAAQDKVMRVADGLRKAVTGDIETSVRRSSVAIRQSLWISGFAMAWALVLVVTMLYYFRVWIFAPMKEIQSGVHRVHSGDFDHPIVLKSKDELEDLATEFNAMTARLAATYSDLARQVNERSRQLVRSERMVSVGFLAAGVAHEINNPLASILFCSEALERRLQEVISDMVAAANGAAPADAEVLTRYLKMIQQEALRCKDITQKLLDFSRTGERKRESTDLAGLIKGVLEVARHLPNCRGRNVVFTPESYVVAPVNGQDMKSVILNLVVNAIDSMDEGGTLTIRLATTPDGWAEMSFADTGCGMAPDTLQNIFEPFFTRSRTGKGTGLGLFISHQIIDQHGGTVEAASAGPGHGSTFTVRVPLKEVRRPETGDRSQESSQEPAILPFPGRPNAA
jgi:two-component system NtrC family sensor kinase